MSILQNWAGSGNISDTDRAAAAKVLDLLAANAVSGDRLTDAVRLPEPERQGGGSAVGGGSSGGGGGGSAAQALPSEVTARCEGTSGDWCGRYLTQQPIVAKVSDKKAVHDMLRPACA